MMNIYFDDGVNPVECVQKCNTFEEAKNWIREQLIGYTMVDTDHRCTLDVFQSSKVALYLVFDGAPITFDENEEPTIAGPIFGSCYFYTK